MYNISMTRNCKTCNSEFKTYPSKVKIGRGVYCSRKCASSTLFSVGHTPWHKGKTGVYTKEQLERITEANKKKGYKTKGVNHHGWIGGRPPCIDCKKQLTWYAKHEARCRDCSSKHYSGANSWSWQGGKTENNHAERVRFRNTLQKVIFERDNYTCTMCNISGVYLQVDHIKSWSKYPELRFDESNCRTLCMECHYLITFNKRMPKGIVWGHNLNRRIA